MLREEREALAHDQVCRHIAELSAYTLHLRDAHGHAYTYDGSMDSFVNVVHERLRDVVRNPGGPQSAGDEAWPNTRVTEVLRAMLLYQCPAAFTTTMRGAFWMHTTAVFKALKGCPRGPRQPDTKAHVHSPLDFGDVLRDVVKNMLDLCKVRLMQNLALDDVCLVVARSGGGSVGLMMRKLWSDDIDDSMAELARVRGSMSTAYIRLWLRLASCRWCPSVVLPAALAMIGATKTPQYVAAITDACDLTMPLTL